MADSTGDNVRELQNDQKVKREPVFLQNIDKISYITDDQLWICNYDGTNAEKLTDFYTGVSGVILGS